MNKRTCAICVEKEKILFTFTNFSFGVRRGRIPYSNGALQPLHNEMKKMKMNSVTMLVETIGNNIMNKNNRAVFIHCSVKK